MHASIRRTSCSMMARSSGGRPAGFGPSRPVCTSIFTEVSGLRSSWATPAATCPTAASCSARSTSRSRCCNRSTTRSISSMTPCICRCRSGRSLGSSSTTGGTSLLSRPAASRMRTLSW